MLTAAPGGLLVMRSFSAAAGSAESSAEKMTNTQMREREAMAMRTSREGWTRRHITTYLYCFAIICVGGREALATQHRQARVFGKARIAESQLAQHKYGFPCGDNAPRVDAGVTQPGFVALLLLLRIFLSDGHRRGTNGANTQKAQNTGCRSYGFNANTQVRALLMRFPALRLPIRPDVPLLQVSQVAQPAWRSVLRRLADRSRFSGW